MYEPVHTRTREPPSHSPHESQDHIWSDWQVILRLTWESGSGHFIGVSPVQSPSSCLLSKTGGRHNYLVPSNHGWTQLWMDALEHSTVHWPCKIQTTCIYTLACFGHGDTPPDSTANLIAAAVHEALLSWLPTTPTPTPSLKLVRGRLIGPSVY